MKALIVGGTQGFGKELANELRGERGGYEVVTIGRTNNPDYLCDVGDLEKWQQVLPEIKKVHQQLDLIIFAVGYARAKSFTSLNTIDWKEHLDKNLLYVAFGLKDLAETARGKVVTLDSQWSYKIGNPELVPYTVAKHALTTLTLDFAARNPSIQTNNYCLPTMDTPQYHKVMRSFQDLGKKFKVEKLADHKLIAKKLIHHILDYPETGRVLKINPEGEVSELQIPSGV